MASVLSCTTAAEPGDAQHLLATSSSLGSRAGQQHCQGAPHPKCSPICKARVLWVTLPAVAIVAWLSDRRWLWFHHAYHADPSLNIVDDEVSYEGSASIPAQGAALQQGVGQDRVAKLRMLPSVPRSPWIPKKCSLPKSHDRCPDMEANVEFTFRDAGSMWRSHVRHVISPEKCCAICQGTKRCNAWSWVKNAGPWKNWYVCFLKGGIPVGKKEKNGVISGRPPKRLPVKTLEKVSGKRGTSLFCFSLMRPGSSEVELIYAQQAQGAGIFACNECMVYSSEAVRIGPMMTSVVNSDLKCTSGGDFGKALNSWIFIEVWRKVIEDGTYYNHNWTVKVDPDAVFFPSRLQTILMDHLEAGYINNCEGGMHGAIEVLSRKAVGALAWDYRASKNGTYPRNCVAAQEMSRWGEDMFLDKCLTDTLTVTREYDVRLLCEGSCGCPDWYWCQNGTTRAAFHPFKSADTYVNCLANALNGGAKPMPPAPMPCAKARQQCGGKGWRGPTCCENGHQCLKNNTWYSQCEPDCAGPLEQCGGLKWKGATCCEDGYECVEKDKWYSQCRPPWAPSFPAGEEPKHLKKEVHSAVATPAPTPKPVVSDCAEADKQCGGRKHSGPSCCPTGYTCWRKNEWYSQCKPDDSAEVKHSWGNNGADCVGPGQQCGGIDYDGADCCVAGYHCKEKNHWYAECTRSSSTGS